MNRILASLAALATISCTVLASPTPWPRPRPDLDGATSLKQFGWTPGAGVHLVECSPLAAPDDPSSAAEEQSWLSLVVYCENDAECADTHHIPQARDVCVKKTSNVTGDFQKWENSEWVYCHFDERGWFSWALSRFARLFPPTTEVGIAEIGKDEDAHQFSGFVDDLSQGAGPTTHNCSKIYYFS